MRNESIIDWEPEMDIYLGQEAEIDFKAQSYSNAYCLKDVGNTGSSHYVFAKEWLTKIQ